MLTLTSGSQKRRPQLVFTKMNSSKYLHEHFILFSRQTAHYLCVKLSNIISFLSRNKFPSVIVGGVSCHCRSPVCSSLISFCLPDVSQYKDCMDPVVSLI